MGRRRPPLSPPTITQSIPWSGRSWMGPSSGSTERNLMAAGTACRSRTRRVYRAFSTDTPCQMLGAQDKPGARAARRPLLLVRDRKSTRLNSSHGYISYAVFCLKKKKIIPHTILMLKFSVQCIERRKSGLAGRTLLNTQDFPSDIITLVMFAIALGNLIVLVLIV